MKDVNWLITLFLGLVLSIPVGLFINLWTPGVQGWLIKRTISSKGKKLERLEKEYSIVKEFKDNPELLRLNVYYALVSTVWRIFGLVVFIPIIAMVLPLDSSSPWPVLILWFFIGVGAMFANPTGNLRTDLTRLINFEEYKKETLTEIASLKEEAIS